jgi:hypothetical protein
MAGPGISFITPDLPYWFAGDDVNIDLRNFCQQIMFVHSL